MTRFNASLMAAALACCVAPAAAPQQPMPTFDHRRLIADNIGKLFSPDAKVRGVAVSELRPVQSSVGLTWAACVRLGATNIGGGPTSLRTYVVTFTMRNQIAERRQAAAKDCDGAKYEPLK